MPQLQTSRLEFNKRLVDGVASCDIFIPSHNLAIIFGGPCDYLQNEQNTKSFNEIDKTDLKHLEDLSEQLLPSV